MAQTSTTTRITQVGTVIVPVSNQDQALEFFTETLGFEKRMDAPYGDGERWLEIAPPGGTTAIALVPPRQGDSAGGNTMVAFTTEDVDADHETLRGRGVQVDEEVTRGGGGVPPMFFFSDPDGNRFLIVQRG
jgi:catechol 2,3-dioxygenase-like lactoylglutathione lyase family enzyme